MATTDCAEHLTQLLRHAYRGSKLPGGILDRVILDKATTKVIINDRVEETTKVVVWKFSAYADIGYEAVISSMQEWLNTESAEWVMENAIEQPTCHCAYNYPTWAIECAVMARLAGPALTEFLLFRKNI